MVKRILCKSQDLCENNDQALSKILVPLLINQDNNLVMLSIKFIEVITSILYDVDYQQLNKQIEPKVGLVESEFITMSEIEALESGNFDLMQPFFENNPHYENHLEIIKYLVRNLSHENFAKLKDIRPSFFEAKELPLDMRKQSLIDLILDNGRIDLLDLISYPNHDGDPFFPWFKIDECHPIQKALYRSKLLSMEFLHFYPNIKIFNQIYHDSCQNLKYFKSDEDKSSFMCETVVILTMVYRNSMTQSMKLQALTLLSNIIDLLECQDLTRLSKRQIKGFQFAHILIQFLETIFLQENESFILTSLMILHKLLMKSTELYMPAFRMSGITSLLNYTKYLLEITLTKDLIHNQQNCEREKIHSHLQPQTAIHDMDQSNDTEDGENMNSREQNTFSLSPMVGYRWENWKFLCVPDRQNITDSQSYTLHIFNEYVHIFCNILSSQPRSSQNVGGMVNFKCLYHKRKPGDSLSSIEVNHRNGVRNMSRKVRIENLANHLAIAREFDDYSQGSSSSKTSQRLFSLNRHVPQYYQRSDSHNSTIPSRKDETSTGQGLGRLSSVPCSNSQTDSIESTSNNNGLRVIAGPFEILQNRRCKSLIIRRDDGDNEGRGISQRRDLGLVLSREQRAGFQLVEHATRKQLLDYRRGTTIPMQDVFFTSPPLSVKIKFDPGNQDCDQQQFNHERMRIISKRERILDLTTSILQFNASQEDDEKHSSLSEIHRTRESLIDRINQLIDHAKGICFILPIDFHEDATNIKNLSPIKELVIVYRLTGEYLRQLETNSEMTISFKEIGQKDLLNRLFETISYEDMDDWQISKDNLKAWFLNRRRRLFLEQFHPAYGGYGISLIVKSLILNLERNERLPMYLFELTSANDAKWRIPFEEIIQVHRKVLSENQTKLSHDSSALGLSRSCCLTSMDINTETNKAFTYQSKERPPIATHGCQLLAKYCPYMLTSALSKNRLDQLTLKVKIIVAKWHDNQKTSQLIDADGLFDFNGEVLWFTPLVTVNLARESLLKLCTLQWYELDRQQMSFYNIIKEASMSQDVIRFPSPLQFDDTSSRNGEDFGVSGLIDWLATDAGQKSIESWVNPAMKNLISITSNTLDNKISTNSVNLFAPKCGSLSVNHNTNGEGILIHGMPCIETWNEKTKKALYNISDLGVYIDLGVQIIPTAYSLAFLRNIDDNQDHSKLLNWNLDVSNDCEIWNTLCVHFDASDVVSTPGSGHCWPIPYCSRSSTNNNGPSSSTTVAVASSSCEDGNPTFVDLVLDLKSTRSLAEYSRGWRYIRIVRNSWQPKASWNLPIGGFEIYGTVVHVHDKINTKFDLRRMVKSSTQYQNPRRKINASSVVPEFIRHKHHTHSIPFGFKRKSNLDKMDDKMVTSNQPAKREDQEILMDQDDETLDQDLMSNDDWLEGDSKNKKPFLRQSNIMDFNEKPTSQLVDCNTQESGVRDECEMQIDVEEKGSEPTTFEQREDKSENENLFNIMETEVDKSRNQSRSCSLEFLACDLKPSESDDIIVSDERALIPNIKLVATSRRYKNNSESLCFDYRKRSQQQLPATPNSLATHLTSKSPSELNRISHEKRTAWRMSQLSSLTPSTEIIPAFDPNRGKGNVPASSEFNYQFADGLDLHSNDTIHLFISQSVKIGNLSPKEFRLPLDNERLSIFHYVFRLVEMIDCYVEETLNSLIRRGINISSVNSSPEASCMNLSNSNESIYDNTDEKADVHLKDQSTSSFSITVDDSFPHYTVKTNHMTLYYGRKKLSEIDPSYDRISTNKFFLTSPSEIQGLVSSPTDTGLDLIHGTLRFLRLLSSISLKQIPTFLNLKTIDRIMETDEVVLKMSDFISPKLTKKISQQLQDPLAISTQTFPRWCLELALKLPNIFPFELRHSMFQRIALGNARCVIWLQENGPIISSSEHLSILRRMKGLLSQKPSPSSLGYTQGRTRNAFIQREGHSHSPRNQQDQEISTNSEQISDIITPITCGVEDFQGSSFTTVLSNMNSALSLIDSDVRSISTQSLFQQFDRETSANTSSNNRRASDESEGEDQLFSIPPVRQKRTMEIIRLHKEYIRMDREPVLLLDEDVTDGMKTRSSFMHEAIHLMKAHSSRKTLLEVQFNDEVGTGLGPTLEFYHLLAMEFSKRSNLMWLFNDDNNDVDAYVNHQCGLFPAPYPQEYLDEEIIDNFFSLGITVAKVLLDKRIFDLQFSGIFLRAIQAYVSQSIEASRLPDFQRHSTIAMDPSSGDETLPPTSYQGTIHTLDNLLPWEDENHIKGQRHWLENVLTFDDFCQLYPDRIDFFTNCKEFLRKKHTIEATRKAQMTHQDLVILSKDIFGDDVGNFMIPFCYQTTSKEYKMNSFGLTGEAEVYLTVDCIEEYLTRNLQFCLFSGIKRQFDSFINGFNTVISIEWLGLFTTGTTNELSLLISGESRVTLTREDLIKYTHPGYGFTKSSQTYIWLIEILSEEFTPEQTRQFLQFTTGSSSLPIGGLVNFQPPLTIVKKDSKDSGPYPSVNTCRHFLKLPNYKSKTELKDRLLDACKYTGFHLN